MAKLIERLFSIDTPNAANQNQPEETAKTIPNVPLGREEAHNTPFFS